MKLKILNIDSFIALNNVKEITSTKWYGQKNKIDPNGIFSEEIFGKFGSRQRKTTFAFIKLNCKIIHPEIYNILLNINTDLTKLLLNKQKYIITDKGTLEENNIEGSSGVQYFINNMDKIKYDKISKPDKIESSNYIIKNTKNIIIDKILVVPAGLRDISKNDNHINISELSSLYEKLLYQTSTIQEGVTDEILNLVCDSIQKDCNDINNWIKNRIKGKTGIIRGGLLKKVTDYSARLVIVPDNNLPLGTVGVPWNICLKLFEVWFINHSIYKDEELANSIKTFMGGSKPISINLIKTFIKYVIKDPTSINNEFKEQLINALNIITKDKFIIYKRDPVENRESILGCLVRVDDTGNVLNINSLDCTKHGGDFDGDAVSVFALLTDEAQKEAKEQLSPVYSKSVWQNQVQSSRITYGLTRDSSCAVFTATKE